MFNDLAWITFTTLVPFLIAQSVILALAIYFDDPSRPVFPRWVAHFNVLVAARAGAGGIRRSGVGRARWRGTERCRSG